MDIANSKLVQWIASIHAAGDDPLEGFVDAPEAPSITLTQQEVNRNLIEKAIASLRGIESDPEFQEKNLREPFVRSALKAPHHRLRDGALPWQVVNHRFAAERSASGSVEPDVIKTTATDRGKKRPHPGDDLAGMKKRKRLRRMLSEEVDDDDRPARPAVSKGRQRVLAGIWPRDGFHGTLRKGDLVRR
ncbi:hypothetical protein CERZMDRAFT_96160 [Cercospora zeae-maydis SCOH1-5]|uniref:Uncharacterized protein n=1 Tax=Cercospora zeae-maydis SCOH1-5 TaxID=717836 RepID=A0A6A6FLF7_9PEZI|nr:hypothetical protein CERZMDRAFT_96160 [Cercospora zeae-maydis SCOH1-5]